jgi:hypothetical protein
MVEEEGAMGGREEGGTRVRGHLVRILGQL